MYIMVILFKIKISNDIVAISSISHYNDIIAKCSLTLVFVQSFATQIQMLQNDHDSFFEFVVNWPGELALVCFIMVYY